MKYKILKSLGKDEETKIIELFSLCSKNDAAPQFMIEPFSMNYYKEMPNCCICYKDEEIVGFGQVFMPSRDEAEITIAVLPPQREKGIFTHIFEKLCKILKEYNIQTVLLVANAKTDPVLAIKEKLSLKNDHSEYTMRYNRNSPLVKEKDVSSEGFYIEKVKNSQQEEYARMASLTFNTPLEEEERFRNSLFKDENVEIFFLKNKKEEIVGSASIRFINDVFYIFGLWIHMEFRGQGNGKVLVKLVTEYCQKKKFCPIELEVDTFNPPALKTYIKCGFEEVDCKDYYKFSLATDHEKEKNENS